MICSWPSTCLDGVFQTATCIRDAGLYVWYRYLFFPSLMLRIIWKQQFSQTCATSSGFPQLVLSKYLVREGSVCLITTFGRQAPRKRSLREALLSKDFPQRNPRKSLPIRTDICVTRGPPPVSFTRLPFTLHPPDLDRVC